MRSKRIFITGGTGFIGRSMLESFICASDRLELETKIAILTRRPEEFKIKAPHLAGHPSVTLYKGDVRDFEFPRGGFSHIIHAATDSSAKLNEENPELMFETIVEGTRRTLEFAKACSATKFLFLSSGAVYGTQPHHTTHIREDYLDSNIPDGRDSAYARGKRTAETLCNEYADKYGIEAKIARGFAFVGPYLNLDIHYAIGNFIRDGLNGGPIRVNGDGTPVRSYLYSADLAVWLWHILIRGLNRRPYNVGSENAVTIAELARSVAVKFGESIEVKIAKRPTPGTPPERYVPSTERARRELNVRETIGLDEAIRKTIDWNLTSN